MPFNVISVINLDMASPNVNIVNAVQYDSSGRVVKAHLQNNGESWQVPSGVYPVIRYQKSDRVGGFYDVDEYNAYAISYEDSRATINITLALQALTTPGIVNMQINFYNNSGIRVTSFAFKLHVERSVIPDSAIISSEYYNALSTTLAESISAIDSVVAAAESISDISSHLPTLVSDWLSLNISNPDSPPLDRSLTISNAAAPADVTGNIKTAMINALEYDDLSFYASEVGTYVKTDGTIGQSSAYRVSDYIEIPEESIAIKIGNKFTLLGNVYYLNPAIVFFDANKNYISSGSTQNADYGTYQIPNNAKYYRFNQPNTENENVSSAITGFWYVPNKVDYMFGFEPEVITFSSVRQIVDSSIYVHKGLQYRIWLAEPYTVANHDAGRINIFSRGNTSKYVILFADMNYVDFIPDASGLLSFYNYGGYIGSIKVNIKSMLSHAVDETPIEYVVKQNNTQFTSLTELLLMLKDDSRPKIIYIDGGDYDIFQEYKDLQNAGKIPVVPSSGYTPSTGYVPYCVFIPDNTHIIGRGLVRLIYSPTASQTTENEAATISPINVAGSMTLENVEIVAKNCRYCIHDDPLQDAKYNGAIKHYINVKAIKKVSDNNLGYTHCFGGGIAREMTYTFDNCYFVNEYNSGTPRTLYFHDRKIVGGITLQEKMSSRIIINNSVIKSGNNVYAVFLGNIGAGLHIRVDINNSFIGGAIVAADENSPTEGTFQNSFDIRTLYSRYARLVVRDTNNQYPPEEITFSS